MYVTLTLSNRTTERTHDYHTVIYLKYALTLIKGKF